MTDQSVINILLGVAGFCISWWVKAIWDMTKSLQSQVTELNIKLAEGYVPRQELADNFSRIYEALDDIRKEIGHISRNQASNRALTEALNNIKGL